MQMLARTREVSRAGETVNWAGRHANPAGVERDGTQWTVT